MIRYLLSFLLPNYCHICGNKTGSISVLCDKCISTTSLKIIKRDIINNIYPDITIVSGLSYDERARVFLHSIKFDEKRFFIEDIFNKIDISFLKENNIEIITYVPLPFDRLLKRGFNQSRVIAGLLSKRLKIKYCGIMNKKKYSMQSKKEHRVDREKIIVENPFYLKKRHTDFLKKISSLIIVDDLITTGSTLRAFIDRLKEINPCLKIFVFTLFYTE